MSSTTDSAPDSPHREAAKYRTRLRDTESQRDALAERLEAVQRATVESMLGRHRITPAALWATTSLADVCDADGVPDPQKVAEAADAARDELGLHRGVLAPQEGRTPQTTHRRSFTDAFKEKP